VNLVCFHAYCGGALICDLLNNQVSPIGDNGDIKSLYAAILKVPRHKNIQHSFQYFFNQKISQLNLESLYWYGTHCFPNDVDVSDFNKVIVVTCNNFMSKVFRLMRIYFLYDRLHIVSKLDPKYKNIDIDNKLLKIKFFNPFLLDDSYSGQNIIPLEFEDLVKTSDTFLELMKTNCLVYDNNHFSERLVVWKNLNKFLYEKDIVEKFVKLVNSYEQM